MAFIYNGSLKSLLTYQQLLIYNYCNKKFSLQETRVKLNWIQLNCTSLWWNWSKFSVQLFSSIKYVKLYSNLFFFYVGRTTVIAVIAALSVLLKFPWAFTFRRSPLIEVIPILFKEKVTKQRKTFVWISYHVSHLLLLLFTCRGQHIHRTCLFIFLLYINKMYILFHTSLVCPFSPPCWLHLQHFSTNVFTIFTLYGVQTISI